jgi:hypothetical protein
MRNLLKESGYDNIAAEKTSKEKFLLDLQDGLYGEDSADSEGASSLWKDSLNGVEPRECLIAADEFNDFVGTGNIDFLSLLGSLWDYEGVYKARVKNSKSVAIPNPTINILAGNTSDRLASAIPIEAIGQGFISRILLVHGEKSERKITFPETPTEAETQWIISEINTIKAVCRGNATATAEAKEILEKIYGSWVPLEDSRFANYSNRRFTHLLKLSLIFCAARRSTEITREDIIYANTVLSLTESLMPRALGEFGKARNSGTANKVIEFLAGADKPKSVVDIFKAVSNDLEKFSDLPAMIMSLDKAGKIQKVGNGFLLRRASIVGEDTEFLKWELLTKEELING